MSRQKHHETELERKLRADLEKDGLDPESLGEGPETLGGASRPEAAEAPVEIEKAADAPAELGPAAALESECEDLKDQLLRARAEFDNYRKRTAREVDRIRRTAAESVLHDLLPVLDNLELALQHAEGTSGPLGEGVQMVLKQLQEILERNGLEAIEALGLPFNPTVHEAISQIESDEFAKDRIAMEHQRGYTLGGQVIRPSKVVVSLGSGAESAQAGPQENG